MKNEYLRQVEKEISRVSLQCDANSGYENDVACSYRNKMYSLSSLG